MRQFLRNTILALASGYALFFFSERLFWSAFKPGDHPGELAITWLAYSVIAYLFLSLLHWFAVRSADAAFLAGAFYGWVTEGALVGTLYGTEASAPFPLSLLCTGVSWHALISVWVGWHFLPQSLRDAQPWRALGWSAAVGVFWGAWATFLWRETPPVVASVPAFAAHAFAAAGLLAGGYWIVAAAGGPARFRPRPFGLCVTVLVLGTFYAQQVRTLGLRPLVILPALVGLVAFALWRAKRRDAGGHAPTPPAPHGPEPARALRRRNLACVLAMPAVATAVYALLGTVDGWERVPVPQIVYYWLTVPVGGAVLAWALVRCVTGWPGRRGALAG